MVLLILCNQQIDLGQILSRADYGQKINETLAVPNHATRSLVFKDKTKSYFYMKINRLRFIN